MEPQKVSILGENDPALDRCVSNLFWIKHAKPNRPPALY